MPLIAGYDAVTPGNIPTSAPAVMGYRNGLYAWTSGDWARFPTPNRKTISVVASEPADVLDVESGDASPSEAPGWVRLALGAGIAVPTLYCSRLGTWPATQAACRGLPVVYWVADYTGQPHLVPGSISTQWTDAGPYDLSVCDSGWFGGSPVPGMNGQAVAIRPTPTGLGYYIFASDGGVFALGDAVFYGSAANDNPPGGIVDAAVTPSGHGYSLVSAAGAVYSFGDARYFGNAP